MKYIVNTSNDPAYNIALEAYAFRELVNEDELFILEDFDFVIHD